MSAIRLLIADETELLRAGVRALAGRQGQFSVLEAADLTGVERALAHAPHVALVDADLPPEGCLEAIRLLSPTTAVVIWGLAPDRDDVIAAIGAGALGYLDKSAGPGEIVSGLRAVLRGEAAVAPALATLLIEALHEREGRLRDRTRAAELSLREREVLGLAAQGAPNRAIASELSISEFTVKRHMQNILCKLGLPSRREAAVFYRRAFEGGVAGSVA